MNESQEMDLARARRLMPPSVLANLIEARVEMQPSGRLAIEIPGPNGGGVIAIGLRNIITYLKMVSGEVATYANGGKNRWLSLATAISAYLHYAPEGPKLEPARTGFVTGKKRAPKHVRKDSTEAMVRKELQRRIQKMTTKSLLKLLGK